MIRGRLRKEHYMVKNKGHTCPGGREVGASVIEYSGRAQSAIAPAMNGVHSRRCEDQNVKNVTS